MLSLSLTCCCSALVQPLALSLGPLCRRLGFGAILEPTVSLLCCVVRAVAGPTASSPPCRAWVIRVIVRPSVHSLGPPFPRLGFCTVVGATMPWLCCSLFGPRVVVALFASSSTLPCRVWADRVVVGLFASSIPLCRAWAVRGFFALSFGPQCRRGALGVVLEPAFTLLVPSHRGWAIRTVVVHSRRRLARRIILVLGPALWSCAVPRVVVQPFPPVRIVVTWELDVSTGKVGEKGENEPRRKSWLVLTHWLGLPLPGSPLSLLVPLCVVLH